MTDEETEQEELLNDAKDFFDSNKRQIGRNLKLGDKALVIDFEELSQHSIEIADNLIIKPEETIQLLEIAAEETEWLPDNIRVRLKSLSHSQDVKIRNIRAKNSGTMISFDGVIRQASLIRSQVTNIKFECPSCGTIMSVLQLEKEQKQPSRCSCGRKGGFKNISEDTIDSQIVVIEESSDNLEDGGDQPQRMKVWLKEDLTDKNFTKKIVPGNKVKVIGVLHNVKMGSNSNKPLVTYDYAIEANNIIQLEEDFEDVELTDEEEEVILEISKRDDLVDYLSNSVAPSVYGNKEIKKALVLQLFGGVSRRRSDNSMSREQIHGLLVGDPGVAKSVILKYLQEITRKSRFISGKGASGVGMTATVTKDELSGGWTLEAGAMVLSNNGSLFIDEFEKMSNEDRSNLHEGMSLGTITIARANVQATLNAKTTILAAANPKFGRFDASKSLVSQINLLPSLLSRFDFIFVMRDIPGKERDSLIADKIFSEHNDDRDNHDILEKNMFKKYISYAKQFHPKLGDGAIRTLKDYYVGLRDRIKMVDGKPAIPLGARQLEGLIRFAEAAAKMRLSRLVTISDAEYAIKIMESYLMEIGYDKENKTFDIDKISGNSAKSRSKLEIIKNAIKIVGNEFNGLSPIEKIKSSLDTQYTSEEIDEAIEKLIKGGDVFRPKRGFIRLM
jgi:replicative DNA helicase Mcm